MLEMFEMLEMVYSGASVTPLQERSRGRLPKVGRNAGTRPLSRREPGDGTPGERGEQHGSQALPL